PSLMPVARALLRASAARRIARAGLEIGVLICERSSPISRARIGPGLLRPHRPPPWVSVHQEASVSILLPTDRMCALRPGRALGEKAKARHLAPCFPYRRPSSRRTRACALTALWPRTSRRRPLRPLAGIEPEALAVLPAHWVMIGFLDE